MFYLALTIDEGTDETKKEGENQKKALQYLKYASSLGHGLCFIELILPF